MSEAREEILARVRSALEPDRPDVPVATQPALATVDPAAMLEEFLETTADYRAVVERCPAAEVPARVAAALERYAARRVVSPPGLPADWLTAYAGEVVVDEGLSAYDLDRLDAVVTAAAVGIAATGTIVLDHQPDQGRRAISLVPDVHVCVVRAGQVVPDVPHAVAALHTAARERRPLTWISGPSATSDIELDRVEGVHGPRTLHVVLSDD